ncbi:MAG: DUF3048 domain-containing protein [Candidatus Gracilibacteria bacterium]|jgi:hypothetical protein|nr:DUF3048 domain-containing protein [Candidatus Gracilibacteria bacterium]
MKEGLKKALDVIFKIVVGLSIFFLSFVLVDEVKNLEQKGEHISYRHRPLINPSKFLFFKNNATPPSVARLGDVPPIHEESIKKAQIVAFMIDNHRYARAFHEGILESDLIMELPAEGGIPRLIALFYINQNLDKIGPIRSARDYFIDVLEYFTPVIVHAGGSPQALEELTKRDDFLNLDHEFGDDYFWRDDKILRPHNLYADLDKIAEYADKNTWNKPKKLKLFEYGDDFVSDEEIDSFEVHFALDQNKAIWKWNDEQKLFIRTQKNEKNQIKMENVVVLVAPVWFLDKDDKGRLGMKTVGEDEAYVFRNGKYKKCKWTREEGGFFELVNEKDEAVKLQSGKTFLEFVSDQNKLLF